MDEQYHTVLMCWPNGKRDSEQIALAKCDKYERDSGADEVEE